MQKEINKIRYQKVSEQDLKDAFLKSMDHSPIALVPHLANKQHYEVPSTFFDFCLGKYKKYSSCYWDSHTKNLDDAIKILLENGSLTKEDKIVVINNVRRGKQEISSTEIINLNQY